MASIPAWSCPCDDCKTSRVQALTGPAPITAHGMNEAMKRLRNYSATIEFRIDPTGYFKSEEKPMTSSTTPTPQSIANDLHRLPENADLAEIRSHLSKVEAERKARIEKALAGQADLALLTGTKGKRFIVFYWQSGMVKSTEGVEYPVKFDSDGDPEGYSVIVNDDVHPFGSRYITMTRFREFFKNTEIPCHIAYFDKQ